jgi:hypothetical protein
VYVVRYEAWDDTNTSVPGEYGPLTDTCACALQDNKNPLVSLHLDKGGDIWHVEFANDPAVGPYYGSSCGGFSTDQRQAPEARVQVEKTGANPGPKPVLNRPVVLNPDGKLPVQEVEKTFLQK